MSDPTSETLRAENWDRFLTLVEQAKQRLGPGPNWYRGHEKCDYTLTPSLFRYYNGKEKERELLQKYAETNSRQLPRRHTGWETLFDMQHYGIPTRLLDWTETLGIAVYFAVSLQSGDPCLFILNPRSLNERSGCNSILEVPTGCEFSYESVYLHSNPPPSTFPLAISPSYPNRRMQRQRGKFTVHGSSLAPLEEQCPECVCQILLSEKAREEATAFLSIANLNAFSMFPDFVGLTQFIRNEAKLAPAPSTIAAENRMEAQLRELREISHKWLLDRNQHSILRGRPNITGIAACAVNQHYVARGTEEKEFAEWVKSGSQPLLFLTGEAGMGKTNFLVEKTLVQEPTDQPLPFFLPLRLFDPELSQGGAVRDRLSLIELMIAQLSRHSLNDYRKPSAHERLAAKRMVQNGRVLLILDGLDELARIRKQDAVKLLFHEITNLIDGNRKARVVISCRDHIFKSLAEIQAIPTGLQSKRLELRKLPEEAVYNKLAELYRKHNEAPVEESRIRQLALHARVPILFMLVREMHANMDQILDLADNRSRLYEAWFKDILRQNHVDAEELEATMHSIGEIAAEMTERRSDVLKVSELTDELRGLVKKLSGRPLSIFVEELAGAYSFSHLTLCEFILAWSAAREIKTGVPRLLCATPSFDYHGMEPQAFLDGLIDVKNDLVNNLDRLLAPRKLSVNNWNNVTRNLFEAIGVLARSDDRDLVLSVAPKAIQLISQNTYKGMHITYRTKYNVVRCLERLHPTSPKPYFAHILTGDWRSEKSGRKWYAAHAIRGFHLKHPRPSPIPRIVLEEPRPDADIRQNRCEATVVQCLIDTIDRLNRQWELPKDGKYLRINASYALIRWLPRDSELDKNPELHSQIHRILEMRDACWRTVTNVLWALNYRYGDNIPTCCAALLKEGIMRHATKEVHDVLTTLTSTTAVS